MLIAIRPAGDHPADYIAAAADDPTEWVRVTPDALPALVLALPDIDLDEGDRDDLFIFGFEDTASEAMRLYVMTEQFVRREVVTTTIDYRDWHRLRMGDRPAAEPWLTVDEIITAEQAVMQCYFAEG